MIADRHPFVVRQQRIVRPEQLADIGRVVDADVEIGVVADARRQVQACSPRPRCSRFSSRSLGAAIRQQGADSASRSARRGPAPSARNRVQRSVRRRRCRGLRRLAVEQAGLVQRGAGRGSRRRSRPRRAARRRGGLNTPSGRFWIGKSGWPLAEATQLRRLGIVRPVELGARSRCCVVRVRDRSSCAASWP